MPGATIAPGGPPPGYTACIGYNSSNILLKNNKIPISGILCVIINEFFQYFKLSSNIGVVSAGSKKHTPGKIPSDL